jgi:hypothetical protein
MNPHAYAQADAMQALKQAFKPQPYMPWFAQQAPTANWAKTYNTAAWMPPWVMTPGTVGTGGTNVGLGGMFGYTGPYGPSAGPGVNGSGTWGGVPGNPLQPVSAPPATYPGVRNTVPVVQQPDGTYQPNMPDPNAGINITPVPKVPITGGQKGPGTPLPSTQTPTYGSPGNTPAQDYQYARDAGNPLPPPTGPDNVGGVEGFLDSFRFSSPTTPEQTKFNQLATQYGVNDAWSWAMSNAWNQLGPSLTSAISSAGLSADDRNRIINTYGARTKDLGADSPYNYSAQWLANAWG